MTEIIYVFVICAIAIYSSCCLYEVENNLELDAAEDMMILSCFMGSIFFTVIFCNLVKITITFI